MVSARRIAMVAVVLVLAAALIWVVMYLNRGSTESAFPAHPEHVAEGKPAVYYQDLGTMTASSGLVFKGTVLSAGPGKVLQFSEDEGGPETERNLRVRVDSVLYNPQQIAVPGAVDVVEGWWSKGEGYAWEGMPWAEKDDAAYFYVTASPGRGPAGPYSYVADFGRVLVNQRGARPSGDPHGGPWQALGASPTEETVATSVHEAVNDATSGKAQPAQAPQQFQEAVDQK